MFEGFYKIQWSPICPLCCLTTTLHRGANPIQTIVFLQSKKKTKREMQTKIAIKCLYSFGHKATSNLRPERNIAV